MKQGPDAAFAATEALPPFAALRAFEAVVRSGGIRKAASSLGVHHSVVSRHLAALETWLGTALLSWSDRRFVLTDQGVRFHARVAAALAELGMAVREVRQGEDERPLRIWCSHGLSIQWLAREIADFEELHPGLRVDLRPSDYPANLAVHEADANLFMHLESDISLASQRGVKAHVLARPLSMIAASPALAAELAWIVSPQDLLNVPLLHGRHTQDWRWWLSSNGVKVPRELAGELCWHPLMALEAARLGRGILLGNQFFFERDLARGELVQLKVPGTTDRPFGAYLFVAREDRWSSPPLLALRRFLAQRMKAMETALAGCERQRG